jgi:hypothetical protein
MWVLEIGIPFPTMEIQRNGTTVKGFGRRLISKLLGRRLPIFLDVGIGNRDPVSDNENSEKRDNG